MTIRLYLGFMLQEVQKVYAKKPLHLPLESTLTQKRRRGVVMVNKELRAILLLTFALSAALCMFFLPHATARRAEIPAADTAAVLVGAGDIADCKDLSGAE